MLTTRKAAEWTLASISQSWGFGVLGGGIAGRQLLMLALSGGKMLLPGVRPGGGFLSTGQQGSASVDEGFRFLLGSFAAIVHDLSLIHI